MAHIKKTHTISKAQQNQLHKNVRMINFWFEFFKTIHEVMVPNMSFKSLNQNLDKIFKQEGNKSKFKEKIDWSQILQIFISKVVSNMSEKYSN